METEKPTRTKFMVHKSTIMDEDGNRVKHGQPIELGPKLAKHYNKLGYLRPFIEETEDDEPTEKVQSRRFSDRRKKAT